MFMAQGPVRDGRNCKEMLRRLRGDSRRTEVISEYRMLSAAAVRAREEGPSVVHVIQV